jgi:glutamate N-acetyltransferase/amino-acid N-acetyltransferase
VRDPRRRPQLGTGVVRDRHDAGAFEPDQLNVAINGVWVCKNGGVGEDRDLVDMRYREVHIVADLAAGGESATIWTNDLTADYVHENSAYSS